MKHIRNPINFKEWVSEPVLIDVTNDVRSEAQLWLQDIMNDNHTGFYMPVFYNENSEHPLDIYLQLEICNDPDNNPIFGDNLRHCLELHMGQCMKDGSHRAALTKVAIALRDLADDIETGLRMK